jgi:large subunit ribosomal protein L18
MSMNKTSRRLKRAMRTRAKIRDLGVHRLCVHRTSQHIYAQVTTPAGELVIASASTVEKDLRDSIKHGGNVEAATTVGRLVAERAKAKGIEKVAFDRSGYRYHGCVKALADAARASGLVF